eukprot:jgi/Chrzof1/9584/Cz04g08120.t1_PPD6[v5.2]
MHHNTLLRNSRQPFSCRGHASKHAVHRRFAVHAVNTVHHDGQSFLAPSRRDVLGMVSGAAATLCLTNQAVAAQTPEVGNYLPAAGVDDFVLFVPDRKKTPAIRAGTVDPNNPYRFALPPSWKEAKVANIQSGNYCQPRCAEPWTEVIFESEREGRLQVIVSPLVRLTNKAGAKLEDIGTPAGVLTSLGAFITGTYLDDEDVVSASSKNQDDGRTYYVYEVNAPYGSIGPHSLSACTTKGDLALLFVVSANDKQWARSETKLRKVVDSFRA